MSAILTAIGSIVTAIVGWAGDCLEMVTAEGNELILLFVIFGFAFSGVGLIKRLKNL